MIELAAIKDLRENNIPLAEILTARAELKIKFNEDYPFATQTVLNSIWKAGRKIVLEDGADLFKDLGGTAQLNLAFIKQFFERIEFENGLASRLRPLGKEKRVIVDPAESGGRAFVKGEEQDYWVEMVVSSYRHSKNKQRVISDLGITMEDLDDSLAFVDEQELQN